MKVFFRRIHLYLALAAGLVIISCCFTGAILVFEDELKYAFNHKNYYAQPGKERVPLQQIIAIIKEKNHDAKIGSIKIYTDTERTLEINYKLKGDNKGKKKNGPEYNWKAFANPYTGKIVDVYDVKQSFFFKVLSIHRWLLADDTGKLITGISTLIFLFIIITGIILWWPANKNILKARFKLKTGAGWKRTNHDWHIVLGFYSSIILFVFAFTALAWSFKWFNNGIYVVTNSPLKNPELPKSIVPESETKKAGLDVVFAAVANNIGNAVFYSISAPKEEDGVYNVSVLSSNAPLETAIDMYYVDAYSGQLVGTLLYKNRSIGAKVRAVFKPLHTGSIWGFSSKILALVFAIIGASLPVTGYIMWYNRIWKKKRN
jgi:uncharacterized iron-regulated membrane protein